MALKASREALSCNVTARQWLLFLAVWRWRERAAVTLLFWPLACAGCTRETSRQTGL